MKRPSYIVILSFCLLLVQTLTAANPKREFRAAWVTTAWAIDWPKNSWGSVDRATEQKNELVQLLDSMKQANMNAVCLQVRSFCDAMYNSKYEPWSQYITGTRGGTPSYDPLAFAIEEAHSRGMELHVWLNPYRYASSTNTYGNLATDYANTHPEWLMAYDNATILNPSIAAVKQRIAAVVADIVENYDIDGVLFDDYFYIKGTPMSQDAELYSANNPNNLSQADWRRENVNEMVRMVHDTIKYTKPWVTFGIGPAPQVASTDATAAKYGVDKMPFSDWQYNGIYSDPLAWISSGTIDYISPQMYWTINSSYSFATFSAWWAKTSNQFGRHFYASHSLDGVGSSFPVTEISDQITCLRNDDRNGAIGSIFYSIREGIFTKNFIQNLRKTVYSTPALPPMKAWEQRSESLYVSNITYSSSTNTLSWTAPAENLRYAVYCIPQDYASRTGIFFSSQYLEGMTYTNSCEVPSKPNYTYAVAVVDRYGNEYSPLVQGATRTTLSTPQLLAPADNTQFLTPSFMRWSTAQGVDSYIVQVATDAAFTDLIESYETADTTFYTGKVTRIKDQGTYYWRIIARGANADDVTSSTYSFTAKMFGVTAPTKDEKDVSLTPLLRADSIEYNTVQYLFEIGKTIQMRDEDIFYTCTTSVPRCQVPDSVLAQTTTYYIRVSAVYSNVQVISDIQSFTTLSLPVPVPEILQPTSGDTIHGDQVYVLWKEQNARSFRVDLSTVESFAPRMTKTLNVSAYTHDTTFTNVAEGNYYLRVRASSVDGWLYSDTLTLVVQHATAVEDITEGTWQVISGAIVSDSAMPYVLYNLLGTPVASGTAAVGTTPLPKMQGVFILQVGKSHKKIIL